MFYNKKEIIPTFVHDSAQNLKKFKYFPQKPPACTFFYIKYLDNSFEYLPKLRKSPDTSKFKAIETELSRNISPTNPYKEK